MLKFMLRGKCFKYLLGIEHVRYIGRVSDSPYGVRHKPLNTRTDAQPHDTKKGIFVGGYYSLSLVARSQATYPPSVQPVG